MKCSHHTLLTRQPSTFYITSKNLINVSSIYYRHSRLLHSRSRGHVLHFWLASGHPHTPMNLQGSQLCIFTAVVMWWVEKDKRSTLTSWDQNRPSPLALPCLPTATTLGKPILWWNCSMSYCSHIVSDKNTISGLIKAHHRLRAQTVWGLPLDLIKKARVRWARPL